MTRNKEGLDINAACSASVHFSFEWGAPLTKTGKPTRIGYRICGNQDCTNLAHITQSAYLAKKHLGYLPNLKRKYKVFPAEPQELIRVAEQSGMLSAPESCQIQTCKRPHRSLGLCKAHYRQFEKWRYANPDYKLKRFTSADIEKYLQPAKGWKLTFRDRYCHVPECKGEYLARGLCNKHYDRWKDWKAGK